jgi:hypothetical protein
MMKKLLLIVVALGCVGLCRLGSHGQSDASSGDQAAKNRISITTSVRQSSFKVGDPIILTIIVKNISEYRYCEKSIVETNHAEWNGYGVTVKDAAGNEVPRISKPLLPLRQRPELSASRGMLCIAPGDTFKEGLMVDQIVNVSEPGTYYVRVIHRDQGTDTDIATNVIQIKIMQ